MRNQFVKFLFLFLSTLLNAQFGIKHYTSNEGLAHDLCYGIMQDRQGRIWLGTDDGLMRYNGNQFHTYSYQEGFESNYVIDAFQSENNQLYVATWGGGLHLFKNNRFISLGLKNKINKLVVNKGKVLCKSIGNDFYVYQKDTVITGAFVKKNQGFKLKINAKITEAVNFDFEQAKKAVYFFSSFENQIKGVYKLSATNDLVPAFPFLKNQIIKYFGVTAEGVFYASDHEHLFLFSKKRLINVIKLPFEKALVKRVVVKNNTALFQVFDSKKATDFIVLYNLQSDDFKTWQPEVFENKLISDILIDNENNYWVSTYGAGLYKIFEENFGVKDFYFANENITDINEDQDNLVFIASNKIFSIDKRTQKTSLATSPFTVWKSFINRKGNLCFLTKDAHNANVLRIHSKKYNIGVEFDYKQLDYKGFQFLYKGIDFKVTHQGKTQGYRLIKDIVDVVPKGNFIYVGLDSGILVFDLSKNKFTKHLLKRNGLPHEKIIDLALVKDKLWIATANGLVYLKNDKIWRTSETDILPSKSVFSMCVDQFGVLWIATQKGLAICKEDKFYAFHFSSPNISKHLFKVYQDWAGQIWVAGNKGVFKIENKKPFEPKRGALFYMYKKMKNLTFEAISYSENNQIMQVRWDNEPWKIMDFKEIDFSKLQFGKYTVQFRNRLGNSDWVYSQKVSIENKAPWYKEWWGLTLIVFVITLMISVVSLIRFKQIQKRNELLHNTIVANETLEKELKEVRENVAQDFHDELGNKLAGITVLSALMKENEIDTNSKSYQQISRIHKDSEDLYYGIKDFIWSIDSKNDDLNELVFYLKDFGDDLFMYTETAFSVINAVDSAHFRLPYYWSRQILLLFKEAMTNTMKYAQAKKCQLSFEMIHNQLVVTFDDDGIGFDKSQLKRINGLQNMEKRASKINAALMLESKQGVMIKLICPEYTN